MIEELILGTVAWIVAVILFRLVRGESDAPNTHDRSRCDCFWGHKSNG